MPIKVVVEFQAKPGVRAELEKLLAAISATHGTQVPGFLGSTLYEVLDSPDGLVEIAEWDSAEARQRQCSRRWRTGSTRPWSSW